MMIPSSSSVRKEGLLLHLHCCCCNLLDDKNKCVEIACYQTNAIHSFSASFVLPQRHFLLYYHHRRHHAGEADAKSKMNMGRPIRTRNCDGSKGFKMR
mmetsp:Transcript_18231/g.27542  ORF Transcript_18231/g.27542 Transcript_18231/m.27542 type:complete len:98 (-) Transcript_18231:23-316(-)